MKKDRISLGRKICLIVLVTTYLGGMIWAFVSPSKADDNTLFIHPIFDTLIITFNAIFLTNFGSLLIKSLVNQNSTLSKRTFFAAWKKNNRGELDEMDFIQFISGIAYMGILSISFSFWWAKDFTSDPKMLVPLVSQSGKEFIAFLVTYIILYLGIFEKKG